MKLIRKKVLVTGAGGFVGSHLVERLLGSDNEVIAFVRYNSRNDHGMLEMMSSICRKRLRVIQGDLRDVDAVRGAVKGMDTVFHLASLIAIPYSYLHPREVVETNVLGTLNVMTASRDLGVKKVVHTSTSEVYGTARYVPIDENHPLQGQSPYSASKIGADKIAESFYLSFKLPVATIRPFNTYGPRQSARSVIPTIITQAMEGDEVFLGALSPRRDFTYVEDVVRAFVLTAEKDETVGRVVNIGSGFDMSIKDIVNKIAVLLNKKLKIKKDPRRLRPDRSEVMRLRADNRLAKKILGWQPEVPLDEGLRLTIDWIAEHKKFYKRGYTI